MHPKSPDRLLRFLRPLQTALSSPVNGLVCVAWHAASYELRVEDADQAVAVLNVRIEEGQRLARLNRFDP